MKRRNFLVLAVVLAFIPFIPKSATNRWDMINATLDHMFPKYDEFEGAQKLGLINFFKNIVDDNYFDKDDLSLLLEGANKLYQKNNHFKDLSYDLKEKILREFEETKDGQIWLSKLFNYAIEAMLSDPIYGGNHNQLGWKAIAHNPGIPQPKRKYAV